MKKKIVCIITIVLLIILIFYLSNYSYILTIEDTERANIILAKKVKPGFEFATLIKHSVQKSYVYEYYRVEKDGTITVTQTKLKDLGWGMPSTSDSKVEFKNGYMTFDDIDRNLNVLPFRVNYIAEPRIIINDKEFNITEYVENNKLIEVYVRKIRNISYLTRSETNAF